jgi:hypothetical protein
VQPVELQSQGAILYVADVHAQLRSRRRHHWKAGSRGVRRSRCRKGKQAGKQEKERAVDHDITQPGCRAAARHASDSQP